MRLLFFREFFGLSEDEDTSDFERRMAEYFREAIPSGEFAAWVAEKDSATIATGGLVVYRLLPGIRNKDGRVGYILNMYTLPKERRKGIGTRLLDELVRVGKEMGLGKVSLHASDDGIRIYQGRGFTEHMCPELELGLIEDVGCS